MYSNNILNFQESTTTLNAWTKNSWNVFNASRTYSFNTCTINVRLENKSQKHEKHNGRKTSSAAKKAISEPPNTLTAIAVKVYNSSLLNPELEKVLKKNQNGYQRNWSTTFQIIRRIIEEIRAKTPEATLLCVDYSKTFHSIQSGKMEQILQTNGFPKETVTVMLSKDSKAMVYLPDCGTDFFDVVARALQDDTLAPN